jgi:ubiquinone/menaquinone biosynthesis C-methylase UbiE
MNADPDSWWLEERAYAGREHFDPQHALRYDAKMDARAEAEVDMLEAVGALGPRSAVVDLGAGSGQFALAAAQVCERMIAVDVSPVMLARLTEKRDLAEASNIEVVSGGFLTYRHAGEPVDLVYSRFALHHLPDFWKTIALQRIADLLHPGGFLRLSDVVYSFDPVEAESRIEDWIAASVSADVEQGWTRAELAEHVRDEHSTFTWLLEPMIERAGFEIVQRSYDAAGMLAGYLCTKS